MESCLDQTTGQYNTAVGYGTDSGNFSGSVILGNDATATADNQFVFGSTGTVAGAVTVTAAPQAKVWNVVINGVARANSFSIKIIYLKNDL
jgi:hypothetical protein